MRRMPRYARRGVTHQGSMSGPLFEPFRAWLVRPEWAEQVIAGAYDAKTPAQRRAIIDDNPYSYFGVTRSREDLDEGGRAQ